MRALVTGATGFIGRRLIGELLRAGDSVTALVRSEAQDLPIGVATRPASMEDGVEHLTTCMRGHDIVYHLAARVSFNPAESAELLRVNAEGTRRILAAACQAGVRRSVIVSSACTMGISHDPSVVLDEDSPLDPLLVRRNPYLASKLAAERHALEAVDRGQWVTIVNPTTVFGTGDRSLNSGTLVRQVAQARIIPVPSGGSNVIDIDDVVAGIRAAARRGRAGVRYILGGANLRFREIIEHIAHVIERRPIIVPMPAAARRPMMAAAWLIQWITGSRLLTPQIVGDTFSYKFYSCRRAELELSWRARRSFTATLADAWEYYLREGLIALPSRATA